MRDAKNWKIPYKGFIIVQDGTNAYPWNIYIDKGNGLYGEHVGYDRTIKRCKSLIDDGCFDEELNDFIERQGSKKNRSQYREGAEEGHFDKRFYDRFSSYVGKEMSIEDFSKLTKEMEEFR